MKLKVFPICFCCWLLVFVSPISQAKTIKVLASIRPLALIVQDLTSGTDVVVETLLPANADPHSWALRISDRRNIDDADLVIWLGVEFERFLHKPLAQRQPTATLVLGDLPGLQWPAGAPTKPGHFHDGHDDQLDQAHSIGGRDLHLWLNPVNAAAILNAVAERLIVLQPELRAMIQPRLQQRLNELAQLHQHIQARLQPLQQEGFVVYHDAYGHFVAAYGLRQLGAVNQLPEQRLSAKKLHSLQHEMAGARCLLVEREFEQGRRLADALALPMVVADALALDPKLHSYQQFLMEICGAFEKCLTSETVFAN